MTKKVLTLALEALKLSDTVFYPQTKIAIAAIERALAQPEQEPASVTYKEVADTMNCLWYGNVEQVQMAELLESKKLYTTPPQRTWVGLTDEERYEICMQCARNMGANFQDTLCKSIEAKLRSKNA
jgi:hypothetical protein